MRRALLFTCLGVATACTAVAIWAQDAAREDRVEKLMEEYTNAPAPSGDERLVRNLVIRDLRALGADVSVDGLDNVIGVVHGTAERPRIMLDAHMDEVSLMVSYIRPDGFVAIKSVSYPDVWLVDKRWVILTNKGPVMGITGARDVHIWPAEERAAGVPRQDIVLDVGANSKEEAEQLGIRPGDGIAPISPFTVMPHGHYAAKAWDDREGLLIVLEALRKLHASGVKPPNTIYFAATVQEEVGMRGAHVAVQSVKPDLGIALDSGLSAEVPGTSLDRAQERMGNGPTVFMIENSMIPNRKLVDFFMRVASEKQIPLQTEVITGGYKEDGSEIQAYDTGRPAIEMAIPTRSTHAHIGVIDRHDFDGAVNLLAEVLMRLDAATVAEITRF